MMSPKDRARLAAIANALGHVVRLEALEIIAGFSEPVTPKQVAGMMTGQSLENVAYHVRTLADSRLIRVTDLKTSRGAAVHYYRANRIGRDSLAALGGLVK
jgi:DNA-binding transcriptional ArsR family regulator